MKTLERKLNLTTIIAISIGGMLGSGIFVLPGIAAVKTGSSIWLAYLIAAICILPAALSKSELSSAMPKSGGSYVYIERAFGPIMGTISGIGLWISLLLKSSFALVGFGAYLMVITDISSIRIEYISIAFLFIIMMINILGVKKVGRVQLIIVVISLLSLVTLLFLGLPQVNSEYLNPFLKHGGSGLLETIAFVYISYAGVTKVAAIAGEVKNPNKNLPIAMLSSLLIISMIYVLIAYTLVGSIPTEILKTDYKPIYTLGQVLGGKWVAYTFAGIGVITLISMANSGVLAASRFPFAMAVDKLLPKKMGNLHQKYLTPVNTIILTCIIMAFVILFLDVEKIAKLASAFMVMMFMSVNLSVIILRETAVQWYDPKYKSPLYPYVQLFGVFSGMILLFYLGLMPIIAISVVSVLGILIYYIYGRKASRIGVLTQYGHIPALYLLFGKKRNYKHLKELEDNERGEILNVKIEKESGVIVPFLGNEHAPTTLIEIGAALNTKSKIQALEIIEVPDQTSLDAFLEEKPKTKSLERVIKRLDNNIQQNIYFESIATHKLSETMQILSEITNIKWLILSWNGRSYNGIFFNNPIGWIISHINSNFALFKCNGVTEFNNILLSIRHNSEDIHKLIASTNSLCKYFNSDFTLLHVLDQDTKTEQIEDIKKTSNKALSGTKGKLLLKISDNPIDSVSNLTSEYDLLILGTPKKDTWATMLFGTGKDKFAISSACSVLRLTIKNID